MNLPHDASSLPPSRSEISYFGRWDEDYSTSWAGSSLLFAFRSRYLYILPGSLTQRHDRWNGGIRTIGWRIDGLDIQVADVIAHQPLCLFSQQQDDEGGVRVRNIEIKMVDWASTFQVDSIVVDSATSLHPWTGSDSPLQMLFIGDSITSGWTVDDLDPLPRGIFDAYSSIVDRIIMKNVHSQAIAFPGIRLVGKDPDPATGQGQGQGQGQGMAQKFWHSTPWSPSRASIPVLKVEPSVIFINLGGHLIRPSTQQFFRVTDTGTNDVMEDIPTDEFINTMRDFINRLREYFRLTLHHLIIISPFGEQDSTEIEGIRYYEPELENLVKEMAQRAARDGEGESSSSSSSSVSGSGLYYLDTTGWLNRDLTMDGIHPTISGHYEIAKRLVLWMEDMQIVDRVIILMFLPRIRASAHWRRPVSLIRELHISRLSTKVRSDSTFHIPIVDFSPFSNPSPNDGTSSHKRKIADEVVSAFKEVGFVYLKGHGIHPDFLTRAFQKSDEFFSLPMEKKSQLAWEDPRSNRGYVQPGREQVTQSSDPNEIALLRAKTPDSKETMEIGRDWDKIWKNRWPRESDVPGFKQMFLGFFQTCHELHVQVMQSIAIGLDLGEHYFDDKINEQYHNLRLLSYPSIPTSSLTQHGQARAGSHSDYGSLTFVFQDNVGGLEVQNPHTKQFHPATPIPGTIVVNVGDLLARWSNDVLRSTLHRVVAPPPNRTLPSTSETGTTTPKRQSIAFFCNPNGGARIECLPNCLGNGEKAKYGPVTTEDYIVGRLRDTYT